MVLESLAFSGLECEETGYPLLRRERMSCSIDGGGRWGSESPGLASVIISTIGSRSVLCFYCQTSGTCFR